MFLCLKNVLMSKEHFLWSKQNLPMIRIALSTRFLGLFQLLEFP